MDVRTYALRELGQAVRVVDALVASAQVMEQIAEAGQRIAAAVHDGRSLFFCGNGGSAAEATHLAAEFVGRFRCERDGFSAISLSDNSSVVTAVGNDYSFEDVFARQVRAYARPGDILVAMSTSGNSHNVIRAAKAARQIGVYVIAMTGERGGGLAATGDTTIAVPSQDTAHIQEAHLIIGHILAGFAEQVVAE